MKRTIFTDEHQLFREGFQQFVQKEMVPNNDRWEAEGIISREIFEKAGENGFLGIDLPEEYGGSGVKDYRFNQIMGEEFDLAGVAAAGSGLGLHNDICIPYFKEYCNDDQKKRWMPGLTDGSLITAIAMSEPGTGSDLASITTTAVKDGETYILNGAKTFISNGINSDLVIVAAKTDLQAGHRGISLLIVEREMQGFERGRNLEKIGRHSQDTAELFFTDVRVPITNLLGEENKGFYYMMFNLAQERLNIAVSAVAGTQYAFNLTLDYVKERQAFGQPIGKFQNTRFKMAEIATELEFAWAFIDKCSMALNDGELTAEEAAMAKWWTTELQKRAIDECLQFHGGYGYMDEYPISRLWRDGRVQSIYGGTTEIMKEIIGRNLGL
ncbi:MAG: acyl-CoA dehydrogenase [marine actinobacterium MedAcidi-G2A]|nr:MAG: acyl-CoA dehydrogenase [marine actinobacterium MedAcidi-G2A]MBA4809421.1 acyl-CoA dehydrogenase family protein [Acidimicrobiales bacterium]OUV01661.1 MAG: acyl-CoA dehydrogenase [Acidimicrobiaceae bacterium TMED77]|tara:strand:+ start:15298 stop:16446 length:1149 start_codon:yes stop_codon:yes gene_type:complete